MLRYICPARRPRLDIEQQQQKKMTACIATAFYHVLHMFLDTS